MNRILPILTVVAAIFVLWYAGAVWLNSNWAYDKAERAGVELSFSELVADTMAQRVGEKRPFNTSMTTNAAVYFSGTAFAQGAIA